MLENEPVANPPLSITQYGYQGKTVYFVPQRCCDIFSDLYDADGEIIGHPDGGITGRGDGRVPDFSEERSNGRIIWEDQRTQGSGLVQGQVPIALGELFARPDRYNDREILLEGFYFHGWESNLFSERMEASGFAEGHLWPRGQEIWVEGSMPTEVYGWLHQQEMMGPLERYGKVRIKGTFQYGDRYGHLGGFDAQIVVSEAEALPWFPPTEVQ